MIALAGIAVTGKALIALVLTLSAARAVVDGIYEVSNASGLERAAGYFALVIAGVAWYAGSAFVLEDLRQTSVLPAFRCGSGRTAINGDLADQVERATSEAGIRHQL